MKILKRLKNTKGETFIEVLAGIAVCALASTILVTSIITGKNIIRNSEFNIDTINGEMTFFDEFLVNQEAGEGINVEQTKISIGKAGDETRKELDIKTAKSSSGFLVFTNKPITPRKEAFTINVRYVMQNGTDLTSPSTLTAISGEELTVTAPQTINGHNFYRWSYGNASSGRREYKFTASDLYKSLTAIYY